MTGKLAEGWMSESLSIKLLPPPLHTMNQISILFDKDSCNQGE